MPSDEAYEFVDHTLYAIEFLKDAIRVVARAAKKGDGLTTRDLAKMDRTVGFVHDNAQRWFEGHPGYYNGIRRMMNERVYPKINRGKPDELTDLRKGIEHVVANMIPWMIDHAVKIENAAAGEKNGKA